MLNSSELYTLNWLILCYVNFTLKNPKKQKTHTELTRSQTQRYGHTAGGPLIVLPLPLPNSAAHSPHTHPCKPNSSGLLPGLQQLEEEEKGTFLKASPLFDLDKGLMTVGFLEHDAIRGKGNAWGQISGATALQERVTPFPTKSSASL